MRSHEIVLATLLIAFCTLASAEEAARRVTLNIRSQPISTALMELGEQAGLQVMVRAEDIGNDEALSPALNGELTVQAALERMLANTGLTYEFLDERTVRVSRGRTSNADKPRAAQLGNTGAIGISDSEATEASSPGRAQAGEALEEIIVTAQKRVERAFDVPMSIVALGSEELRERRIAGIDDLAMAVPGFVSQSNGSTRRMFLRGISNITGNSSLIGLYLDEASATTGDVTQLDLRTYDLERVEVLRGPQGTLYGEGSAGGTIRFITRSPALDRFAMNADVAAMFTKHGAPSQRIEAVANMPVVQDVFGLRIAGTFDHAGGWIDQPAAAREDYNDQKLADVRVRGLWQISPEFSLNATALVHRNHGPISTGEDADGNLTQVFSLMTAPRNEDDFDLYNVTATYDFAAVRLLSTSSLVKQTRNTENYGNRFLGFDIYYPLLARESDVFTQELRLASIGEGYLHWTLGTFYRDAQSDTDTTFHFGAPIPPGTPLPPAFTTRASFASKSWAAFGDASVRFGRMTWGAGLRYFEDDEDSVINVDAQTGTFDALTGRLYVQYALNDHVNLYASGAEGFRTGGFNALNQPSYDPESVRTYELGTKALVLDARLSAELALFHSDYTDYQISGILPPPAPPLAITGNAGTARIRGVEWAFTLRPSDAWSFRFNGSYIDSEFTEVNAADATHAQGDPVDLFPDYSYTVSVQRDFGWLGRSGSVRIDYEERGRQTLRNRRFGPTFYNESDIINLLNLNIDFQWTDNLSWSVFAQNLLNDRGFLDPQSIQDIAPRSRPLTVGAAFSATLD